MPPIKPEISTASDANSRAQRDHSPALGASELAPPAVSNVLSLKNSETSANEIGSTSKKDFFERLPAELRGLILQGVISRPDRNALRGTNRAISAIVDLQDPDYLKHLATWSFSDIFATKKILSRHIDLIALSKSLEIYKPVHHSTGHLNGQMSDINLSLGVVQDLVKNAPQITHFVFPQDYRIARYIPSTALAIFPSTQPESLDISECSWLYGQEASQSASQLRQFSSLTSLAVCAGDLSRLNEALDNKPYLQLLKIKTPDPLYYPYGNENSIQQCVNLQSLTSLTTLDLHGYPLDEINIAFVVDHLPLWSNLSSLSLAEKENTQSKQSPKEITEDHIEQDCPNNLKELHLSSKGEGYDLCELIQGSKKLRTLTLNISDNDNATKKLFKSFSSIETIQNLKLSGGTENPVEISINIEKLASLVQLKNFSYSLCDGWHKKDSIDFTNLLSTLASLPHLERLALFPDKEEIFDIPIDHEAFRTMPEFKSLTHLEIGLFGFEARPIMTPNFFAKMPNLHILYSNFRFLDPYEDTDEIIQSVRSLRQTYMCVGMDKGFLQAFPNVRTLELEEIDGSELDDQTLHAPVVFNGILTLRVKSLKELFGSQTSPVFPDVCTLEVSAQVYRSLDFSTISGFLQRFPALQGIYIEYDASYPQNEFVAYFNGIKDAFQVKPDIQVIKVFEHRSMFGASNCKMTENFWGGY